MPACWVISSEAKVSPMMMPRYLARSPTSIFRAMRFMWPSFGKTFDPFTAPGSLLLHGELGAANANPRQRETRDVVGDLGDVSRGEFLLRRDSADRRLA